MQVDEVKVFGIFGGDLPVDGSTVKLDGKAYRRLYVQESSMTDESHKK
ncbi:hypothetical protein [Paenibacillus sp. 1_12]|nr:hypothetical protein [Paenibacillus sp. 1_12]